MKRAIILVFMFLISLNYAYAAANLTLNDSMYIMHDAPVYSVDGGGNENANNGGANWFGTNGDVNSTSSGIVSGQTFHRSYLMFNISNITSITDNIIVTTAYLYLWTTSIQSAFNDAAHHVNVDWSEGVVTGLNQPCSHVNPINASNCNQTAMSNISVSTVSAWYQFNVTTAVDAEQKAGRINASFLIRRADGGTANSWHEFASSEHATAAFRPYMVVTYENQTVEPDTTPPSITYYNLTNENGCENWNTDKNTACSTSSVTPTVQFNTSENAWCAIGGGNFSTSGLDLDKNYTDIGSSRNCTGAASGEGATSHLCTLTSQDELVYDTSYLYISCKDSSNNQNITSSSGALALSITGLEAARRNSIGIGIQNALLSGYTNYTDLQIYARNLSNAQVSGTFDRAVKKGTKMWAFNGIGVSDSHVNMFNLTPVLYNLEFANATSQNLTNMTQALIEATK